MSSTIILQEGCKFVVWRVYRGSTKRERVGTYNDWNMASRVAARG